LKHGKNPTVKQCKIIRNCGLNYRNWLVIKHTSTEMVLVHRETKHQRKISLKEKATGIEAR
jgi:hypothetical protein